VPTVSTASTPSRVPNEHNFYDVTAADLPLHCPLPGSSLWNSHPRVYLPIEETGEARCHYCGARYKLVESVTNR
jgi:uncharacterized Zn-finger protein